MGLTFTVGTPSDVFEPEYALRVQEEIQRQLQYSIPTAVPYLEPHYSDEVAWSGWAYLQEQAAITLGESNVLHLLSVDAWQGVYLPVFISPTEILIKQGSSLLQCASLFRLFSELEHFAEKQSLPVRQEELEDLWNKYMDDEESGIKTVDEDVISAYETYTQIMLSAQVAVQRTLPLWVVK